MLTSIVIADNGDDRVFFSVDDIWYRNSPAFYWSTNYLEETGGFYARQQNCYSAS